MRIVFAGTPEIAVPAFRALHEAGHDIVLALTREDAKVGRKQVLTPSPISDAATSLGVPVLKSNRMDATVEHQLLECRPELGVVVAFGALLPQRILDIPEHGWLNIHFSLLPKWRGAAPVQHALMSGDAQTGVSIFQLDAGLDTGPVYARSGIDLPEGVSAGELLAQLAELSVPLLLNLLPKIAEKSAEPVAQVGEASYAPKLSTSDAHIDLRRSDTEVLRRWAGVTPEPGAWVRRDGKMLKLLELRRAASDAMSVLQPGECQELDGRILAGTGSRPIELVTVQPEGKRAMPAADWFRGISGSCRLELP